MVWCGVIGRRAFPALAVLLKRSLGVVLAVRPAAPLVVHRDDEVWRWTCRHCARSDWRVRHCEALVDAHRHVAEHRRFGFKSSRRGS